LASLPKLTEFNLGDCGITDLGTLPALPNLKTIDLTEKSLSKIQALAAQRVLVNLNITSPYNDPNPSNTLPQIRDISPLSKLKRLTTLDLSKNHQISDLRPLSGLTNLTTLTIAETKVANLQPLSNLTALTSLTLSRNQISNVSSLSTLTKLTDLSLDSNQIQDVKSLGGCVP
jgi:internalin A